jgi:3-hydroxyacyl-[acyl-carrier-protein] dehydratase
VIPNHDSTPEDDPALRETLKRCSPATYYAACKFRKTANPDDLRTVIVGIIERFVERELRPKLQTASDALKLSEDLAIDSLTMMEIVMVAEEVLGISVSNEELIHLRTIGDVRQFVGSKLTHLPFGGNSAPATAETNGWDLAALGEQVRRIESTIPASIERATDQA